MRELVAVRADIAFIGACAVSANGYAVFDPDEADFKQAIVGQCAQSVVAMTTGKLSTAAPFRFAALDDPISLVVESNAPDTLLEPLHLPAGRLHRAAPARKGHRP